MQRYLYLGQSDTLHKEGKYMKSKIFYNLIYKIGTGFICRNIIVGNAARIVSPPILTKFTLSIGIFLTKIFIMAYDTNWNAIWILGKAYQHIGAHEKSYDLFQSAHTQNPEHPDIVRELSGECLALGRVIEAEKYCRRAIEINPNDPTLQSNFL